MAFADSVIWVAESTDLIVVPAGIPVPETSMPGARVLVEVRLLTTALELCVVPVMGPAVKASVEPVPLAVANADSVIWVAESTDLIVVPVGIPIPETSMPGAKVLVEVRLVTAAFVLRVLPVIGPAVKASATPVSVAVAGAESVIRVGESTELIVVPAGIPVPETIMPAARALVEVRLVTTGLVMVTLPVMESAEKTSAMPVPVAVACADSVILDGLSIF